MLAFLPPVPAGPRPDRPEPQRRTAIGIALAVILTLAGLCLPWLRHQADRQAAPRHAAGEPHG